MTDIEAEARRRLNEAAGCKAYSDISSRKNYPDLEAMCRLLEEFEAYKREVSDAVVAFYDAYGSNSIAPPYFIVRRKFDRFILPKPVDPVDPVAECLAVAAADADQFRVALAARGLEIREKAGD